ncbi:MAG: DUF4032 domain-containing protein [Ignavibacteriales bacterium]|nr:DUF4032 domain-containing protein [Ignavibacteriales bacterium]
MDKKYLVLNIEPEYRSDLENLPWDTPLNEWNDKQVKFLEIRKGISKHTVRFIKTKDFSFAIKQTNPISAYFESETFTKLLQKGIHTLIPAGYIFYKKNLFEKNAEEKESLAFIVTILEAKSIPHSILFKWDFSDTSRKSIYKSAAELLANLHFNNIFWGDASLSNILIKFIKSKDDRGKSHTELKAFLSDSETIQFLKEISDQNIKTDVKRFYDSMTEISKEFPKDVKSKIEFDLSEDKKYFKQEYKNHFKLLNKIVEFENITGLEVQKHFFKITDQYSIDSILKQIEEHKWYLSEKSGSEINITFAANEWIEKIYKPIINEFNKLKIFDYFPNTNSVKLYTDIMAHKYYLSIEKGEDIGIYSAIRSYSEKHSDKEESLLSKFIEKLLKRLTKIVPPNYNL